VEHISAGLMQILKRKMEEARSATPAGHLTERQRRVLEQFRQAQSARATAEQNAAESRQKQSKAASGKLDWEHEAAWRRRLAALSVTALILTAAVIATYWGLQPCNWLDSALGHRSGCVRRLATYTQYYIPGLLLSPDGQTLVVAADSVRGLDTSSGNQVFVLQGSRPLPWGFSPDGRILYATSGSWVVSRFDTANGQEVGSYKGGGSDYARDLSPDFRLVAATSSDSSKKDYSVKIWDVSSGRLLQTLAGHTQEIQDAIFSPDGSIVATASWDDSLRLWDTQSGRLLRAIKSPDRYSGYSPDHPIFSRDGRILAVEYGGRPWLWGVNTGQEYRSWGDTDFGVIGGMAFSPSSRLLAVCGSSRLALLDVTTGSELASYGRQTDQGCAVIFSLDGRTLFSGGRDGAVKVWRIPQKLVE